MPATRRYKTKAGNPRLARPPADPVPITPSFRTLDAGTLLQRVYSPQPYETTALTFRVHGPHSRFDHQRRDTAGKPQRDQRRGIMYAGYGLICCLGEFFADAYGITVPGTRVASIRPTADLTLLDLTDTAATGVGTTQAVSAISERKTSQAWGRYLYEHPDLGHIDGLLYTASNSGHHAIAFFERAESNFERAADLDLGDPTIRPDLELAADALNWPIYT